MMAPLWAIKRTLLWGGAALLMPVLLFCVLVAYPDPLFAFSLGSGKIVVSSTVRFHPSAESDFCMTARDCWTARR
jgi:hypothetical protein